MKRVIIYVGSIAFGVFIFVAVGSYVTFKSLKGVDLRAFFEEEVEVVEVIENEGGFLIPSDDVEVDTGAASITDSMDYSTQTQTLSS